MLHARTTEDKQFACASAFLIEVSTTIPLVVYSRAPSTDFQSNCRAARHTGAHQDIRSKRTGPATDLEHFQRRTKRLLVLVGVRKEVAQRMAIVRLEQFRRGEPFDLPTSI